MKLIPAPQDNVELIEEKTVENQIMETEQSQEDKQYYESTRVKVKPSLWQSIKQSKIVRAIKYIARIRVVLDVPALPSGDEDRNN